MNKDVKKILDTLAKESNIFKIIELSKELNIDLLEYLHLIPNINVNFDDKYAGLSDNQYAGLSDNQFFQFEIFNIDEFSYIDGDNLIIRKVGNTMANANKYLDEFLYNIEKINYINFKPHLNDYNRCYLKNGKRYADEEDDYSSIEFIFHNLSGYAFESHSNKFYAIDEKIYEEKEYKMKVRKHKMKRITNVI